jgi:hypothetical protein
VTWHLLEPAISFLMLLLGLGLWGWRWDFKVGILLFVLPNLWL